MTLTKEQWAAMLEAANPLIKWLNDNCHPHCKVLVEPDRAEVLEGLAMQINDEFIKD